MELLEHHGSSDPGVLNGNSILHCEKDGSSKAGRKDQRLFLIVGNPVRRQCLEYTLKAVLGTCIINSFASCEEATEEQPDLFLIEVSSSSERVVSIREQVGRIRARFGSCPIMIMSDDDDVEVAKAAMRCGISGYLLPMTSLPTFVAAIRLAMTGGTYVPSVLIEFWASNTAPSDQREKVRLDEAPARAGQVTDALALSEFDGAPAGAGPVTGVFTLRELDVLERLQRGQPNKLIAFDLHMSESTVKVHMRNIMRKLGATNRTQVAFITRGTKTGGQPATGSSSWSAAQKLPCGAVNRTGAVSVTSGQAGPGLAVGEMLLHGCR